MGELVQPSEHYDAEESSDDMPIGDEGQPRSRRPSTSMFLQTRREKRSNIHQALTSGTVFSFGWAETGSGWLSELFSASA